MAGSSRGHLEEPKGSSSCPRFIFLFHGVLLTTPSSPLRESDQPRFKAHHHNPKPSQRSACQSHGAPPCPSVPSCSLRSPLATGRGRSREKLQGALRSALRADQELTAQLRMRGSCLDPVTQTDPHTKSGYETNRSKTNAFR